MGVEEREREADRERELGIENNSVRRKKQQTRWGIVQEKKNQEKNKPIDGDQVRDGKTNDKR